MKKFTSVVLLITMLASCVNIAFAVPHTATVQQSDFTFNSSLLTNFNTVTAPEIGNGANEPKFSYNSFLEENISDYSGELTLNFEDLVLEGVNGLDLRIGRLLAIVDRFGNTIKFEHTMSNITNIVPEGNFRYDDKMWTVSSSNGTYDAFPVENMGRNDNYSMWFHRENENAESYILHTGT